MRDVVQVFNLARATLGAVVTLKLALIDEKVDVVFSVQKLIHMESILLRESLCLLHGRIWMSLRIVMTMKLHGEA
jgi:hypothetical protein